MVIPTEPPSYLADGHRAKKTRSRESARRYISSGKPKCYETLVTYFDERLFARVSRYRAPKGAKLLDVTIQNCACFQGTLVLVSS